MITGKIPKIFQYDCLYFTSLTIINYFLSNHRLDGTIVHEPRSDDYFHYNNGKNKLLAIRSMIHFSFGTALWNTLFLICKLIRPRRRPTINSHLQHRNQLNRCSCIVSVVTKALSSQPPPRYQSVAEARFQFQMGKSLYSNYLTFLSPSETLPEIPRQMILCRTPWPLKIKTVIYHLWIIYINKIPIILYKINLMI